MIGELQQAQGWGYFPSAQAELVWQSISRAGAGETPNPAHMLQDGAPAPLHSG